MLGKNILQLRKQKNLSQEQLGEMVHVIRQTISNWELGETNPNPNQLKLLSKALNVSIDELLNNDIRDILETKVSNTEKLAGVIIKILKLIGVLFIIYIIFIIGAIFLYGNIRKTTIRHIESVGLSCSLDGNDYFIELGSDGYFNCSNCSKELQKELKNDYIDFSNINKTEENISSYFENHDGICE